MIEFKQVLVKLQEILTWELTFDKELEAVERKTMEKKETLTLTRHMYSNTQLIEFVY